MGTAPEASGDDSVGWPKSTNMVSGSEQRSPKRSTSQSPVANSRFHILPPDAAGTLHEADDRLLAGTRGHLGQICAPSRAKASAARLAVDSTQQPGLDPEDLPQHSPGCFH